MKKYNKNVMLMTNVNDYMKNDINGQFNMR